jgi:hypothetical protein
MMRVVLSLERRRLMIFSEFIGGALAPTGSCLRQSQGLSKAVRGYWYSPLGDYAEGSPSPISVRR